MFDAHCHIHAPDAVFCAYEASLDRRLEKENPLEKQEENVRLYLLSHSTAVLHCVRCTGRMIDILRDIKPSPKSVLWHNFSGSKETASILSTLGVIVSIGPRFHGDLKAVFDANPLFTLESDYTGSSLDEHEKIIMNHYERCSEEIGISMEKLEEKCRDSAVLFTHTSCSGL